MVVGGKNRCVRIGARRNRRDIPLIAFVESDRKNDWFKKFEDFAQRRARPQTVRLDHNRPLALTRCTNAPWGRTHRRLERGVGRKLTRSAPHEALRLGDRPSNCSRAALIVDQCVCSQVTSPRTGCMNCLPRGVSAYSTRGGTSA